MRSHEINKDLTDVKAVLLGITSKLTDALKETADKFDEITHQIYEFNRLMLSAQLKMRMSGHSLPDKDKALLEKARDVIEGSVYKYISANNTQRQELKQEALKKVTEARDAVKAASSEKGAEAHDAKKPGKTEVEREEPDGPVTKFRK